METGTVLCLDLDSLAVQIRIRHDFPKRVQYAVEITIGLQRFQWYKGFSEKNIQTLLYNLEADAGVFCPDTFSDDLVCDSALAFIDIFNLVKKKIGIEKNI